MRSVHVFVLRSPALAPRPAPLLTRAVLPPALRNRSATQERVVRHPPTVTRLLARSVATAFLAPFDSHVCFTTHTELRRLRPA
jgi:hypothetical protein